MKIVILFASPAPIKNPEEYVAVIPYKDVFKLFSLLNKTAQHGSKRRRRRPPPRPYYPVRRTTTTTTTTKRPTTKAPKKRPHRTPKPRRTTRAATTTTHRPKKIVKVRSKPKERRFDPSKGYFKIFGGAHTRISGRVLTFDQNATIKSVHP